jgi:propionyl-CoA carboxylase alpha chain
VTPQGREIRRLLVANRGEIARRVLRTAAAMGIETVAVYAPTDADAPFVREADHAVALEGRDAATTYLSVDRLVRAALKSGADAVHPGYGFLSERAAFAEAVLAAGLVWVGPPPAVIDAMGDKLRAKEIVAAAGVPVLPSALAGGDGGRALARGRAPDWLVDAAPEEAARRIGFPLLVKAAAGGGGRGMRVVERLEDYAGAVEAARREAFASFGDGTVFLERLVTDARHVELQVLADRYGAVVHCFERECSIQRRHQKLVEESPSPALDPGRREAMAEAALAAARAVGYEGAGTVEFLLTPDGEFFFLEMNTRLQVEHPVTEAVLGIDLVRAQLLVAEGRPLEVQQHDLRPSGHAIEARLYAEDPANAFLPAPGTIVAWEVPAWPPVRVDSGVEEGSSVGVEWDPLLAKFVAHAPTRREAALRLALALERTVVRGVVTNRDLLVATLRAPEFLAGRTTTSFLERVAPPPRRVPSVAERRQAAVVATAVRAAGAHADAAVLRQVPAGFRTGILPPERWRWQVEGEEVVVAWRAGRGGVAEADSGDGPEEVVLRSCRRRARRSTGEELAETRPADAGRESARGDADLEIGGRRVRADWQRAGDEWWVQTAFGEVRLRELRRFPEPEPSPVAGGLTAPMPGVVLDVAVHAGDDVREGQLLVVVEAMKMEHRVTAPTAGTVRDVRVSVGDHVSGGDLLVVVDEGGGGGE